MVPRIIIALFLAMIVVDAFYRRDERYKGINSATPYNHYLFHEARDLYPAFPFMVMITVRAIGVVHCVGSLVTDTKVITSKYCMTNNDNFLLGVLAKGEWFIPDPDSLDHTIVSQFSSSNSSIHRDIRILVVSPPFDRSEHPPAPVINGVWVDMVKAGNTKCKLLGYGQMMFYDPPGKESFYYTNRNNKSLTYADVVPVEKCPEAEDGEVCVQQVDSSENFVCYIHEGGPLLCGDSIVGIYSGFGGENCTNRGKHIRITLIGNDNPGLPPIGSGDPKTAGADGPDAPTKNNALIPPLIDVVYRDGFRDEYENYSIFNDYLDNSNITCASMIYVMLSVAVSSLAWAFAMNKVNL